jgi:DNA-binding beta-propeller fold protein YncE
MVKTTLFLSLATVLGLWLPVYGEETGSILLTQTISLPDIPGGFNHMSADGERRRLFVTVTTKGTLEIIDLHSGKPWRSLAGERPAAALFAPEFNQLYVTRGQKLCIYDGNSFDLLTSIDLQCGLDELQYDPKGKRLFVGCMTSNNIAIAIIGVPDGKLKGVIKLPAKPQGFVVEQHGNRIFANLPSLKLIAVLDREKQTLLATWPLDGASGNYPIALDEENHRLFVGCRQPAQLVIFDTVTGKSVTSVASCGDTDDLSWDAAHKRIYIACGEGFVNVISQVDADHYQLRERISTRAGARNSCFSPDVNEFYLAVPQREGRDGEIRIYQPK